VTAVESGTEAVDLTDRRSFDLALMDMQMPGMDGLEATAIIRERERKTGGHIPIVAITAHAMNGDRERCLNANMDGYVAKPLRRAQLIAAVERWAPPAAPPPSGPERAPDANAGRLFNRDEFLDDLAGNRDLAAKLARLFLETTPGRREKLRRAVEAKDASGIVRGAHLFAGTVGQLGAEPVREAALRLEELGRTGNFAEAVAAFEAFEQRLGRLIAEIEDYAKGVTS
jgi:CheY-like chemotaxis protein